MSKAFDKVYRPLLWLKMFKRSVNPYVIAVLIKYYEQSLAIIELEGERTEPFRTLLGVKQGGPSSPTLFNFIGYDMIIDIEKQQLGINLGQTMVDIIVYADDTLLVTDSSIKMNKMIKIIENYATNNELEINVKKTFIMTNNGESKPFTIFGKNVENVNKIKYLGSEIMINLSNKAHVEKRKILALTAAASLKAEGLTNNLIDCYVKARLYSTFIRPILSYGLENCTLTNEQIKIIATTEGNILKRMLGIPKTSRTTDLFLSLNMQKAQISILIQKMKFYQRLRNNQYTNQILIELNRSDNKDSFVTELKKILNVKGTTSLEAMDMQLEHILTSVQSKFKVQIASSTIVPQLHSAFEIDQHKERTAKITELLSPAG